MGEGVGVVEVVEEPLSGGNSGKRWLGVKRFQAQRGEDILKPGHCRRGDRGSCCLHIREASGNNIEPGKNDFRECRLVIVGVGHSREQVVLNHDRVGERHGWLSVGGCEDYLPWSPHTDLNSDPSQHYSPDMEIA